MSNSKVALIIGCDSTIGRETSKLLAEKSYDLCIVGEEKHSVDELAIICSQVSPHKSKVR